MQFVLDEFILILFLAFLFLLISSFIILIHFQKFLILPTREFKGKSPYKNLREEMVGTYGIEENYGSILEVKKNISSDE